MNKSEAFPIATILGDERWFGDADVTWDRAPESSDAERLTDVRVKRLRRKPQNRPRPDFAQLTLADNLASCVNGRRCRNGACPQCGRAVQRWLTSSIVDLAQAEPGTPKIALTLIPSLALSDNTSGDMLKNVFADIGRRVASIELVRWAVLGLDVSYNDFTTIAPADWEGSSEGWQPHVHGVVSVETRAAAVDLKKALKELFPAFQGIQTPVYGRFYDNGSYWASYTLKYEFKRRVSFIGKDTGCLHSDEAYLTAEQDIILMRAMGEFGLAGRIHLIGLNTTENTSKNQISLVSTIVSEG